jgi:ATP-binding cassette subfamily B protein
MFCHDLAVDIYYRVLYQPYDYHLTNNSSEIIAADRKVERVTLYMFLPLIQAIIAVTISTFILAALIAIDALTALGAAIGFGSVYLAITAITRNRLYRNSRTIARTHSQLVRTVQEGLGGIRDVLINNVQAVYRHKFETVSADFRRAEASNLTLFTAPRFAIEAAGMVLIAFLALILSRRDGGLTASLPVLGALALGAQRLLPLSQQIYGNLTGVWANRDTLFDVLELLALPLPLEHLTTVRVERLCFENNIVLDKVSFCYAPDRAFAVHDCDLVINKGTRLGLVGPTGSGKSTVADLLMGLLEPTEGTIRIDGRVLDRSSVPRWQARVAHVPQAIFLSDTTIAENIAFGVPADGIDVDRVREAARMAEIGRFIETLPAGYFTTVGERGVRLSGGQRQRIGIARALYRSADVLVFDEATSALDDETEADVMRAIAALGRNLTVVVIAHRLSTVALCDQVVRLEEGRVMKVGTYDDVVLAHTKNRSVACLGSVSLR